MTAGPVVAGPAPGGDPQADWRRLVALGFGWALLAGVLGLIIWALAPVLTPFLFAITLSVLLNPAVTWLAVKGLPRVVAAIAVALLAFGSILLGLALALPYVLAQAGALIGELPSSLEDARSQLDAMIPEPISDEVGDAEEIFSGFVSGVREYFATGVAQLGAGFAGLLNFLKFWVVMPVVTVYLLIDWPRIVLALDRVVPRPAAPRMRQIGREIEQSLASYIRGQVTVCAILIAYYCATLSAVGLPYAIAVGVITGAVSFIPYVGMFIGTSIGMGVALWQFWGEWGWIAAVGGIYAAGLLAESEFLVPKMVGGAVNLHPVWLIFAVLAFGALFGFIGALVAVPLAAVLGVVMRHMMEIYYQSALYLGPDPRKTAIFTTG